MKSIVLWITSHYKDIIEMKMNIKHYLSASYLDYIMDVTS